MIDGAPRAPSWPLLGLTLLSFASGCSSGPSAYQRALERAQTFERSDDTAHASAAYDEAIAAAPNETAKDEARYRRAFLRARAAKTRSEDARSGAEELVRFATERPGAERAPRALLDAARAFFALGEVERARGLFLTVVERYPDSAGALRAAQLWIELEEGDPVELHRRLIANTRSRTLEAGLRYHLATILAEVDPRSAVLEFQEVARRDPLPTGRYADEALLQAAVLRRRLGDAEGALATLSLLHRARARSLLVGSYERSSFAQARFLEGEIFEEQARPTEAEASFLRVVQDHPTSRLLDDALFRAASAARAQGRSERACHHLEELERRAPDSRFVSCRSFFCGPDLVASAACQRAQGGPPFTADDASMTTPGSERSPPTSSPP